jgi:peptidoglycan L-alanyl-D-glutamate endopeptidase CwlK
MKLIIDSKVSLEEAITGTKAPTEVINNITLIDVEYISFDGFLHRGQIVVHKRVAAELKEIFKQLVDWKFPIEKVIPVNTYKWSDEDSMADNNSSAFNYRLVYGTNHVSNHSYGLAIDINPRQNPYIAIDGKIFPEGSEYNIKMPGTLVAGDKVVSLFESKGWEWGGNGVTVGTSELRDWQHFQKIEK